MPIYHFIVDYTCENLENSKLDVKSNIIVLEDSYEKALEKVHTRLRARKSFMGDLESYNITIDWIDNIEVKEKPLTKLPKKKVNRSKLPGCKYKR